MSQWVSGVGLHTQLMIGEHTLGRFPDNNVSSYQYLWFLLTSLIKQAYILKFNSNHTCAVPSITKLRVKGIILCHTYRGCSWYCSLVTLEIGCVWNSVLLLSTGFWRYTSCYTQLKRVGLKEIKLLNRATIISTREGVCLQLAPGVRRYLSCFNDFTYAYVYITISRDRNKISRAALSCARGRPETDDHYHRYYGYNVRTSPARAALHAPQRAWVRG